MRIIQTTEYDAVSGQEIVLQLVQNQTGSTVTGQVDIQTNTNLPFTVTASVDGKNFLNHSILNMGTYEVITSPSSAGHYMVPTSGLSVLKIIPAANGKIFAKEIY